MDKMLDFFNNTMDYIIYVYNEIGSGLLIALSSGLFAAMFAEACHFMRHRPCMKVHYKSDGIYFPSSVKVDKCAAPYRLFFQVMISNESPDPIAITGITLHLEGIEEELLVNDFIIPAPSYDMEQYFSGMEKEKWVTKRDSFRIENPIRGGTVIRPYEAINGVIFIMGCPEIKVDEIAGVLKINTTRKNYDYKVKAIRYRHEQQKYID